jgi:hypothetical protein
MLQKTILFPLLFCESTNSVMRSAGRSLAFFTPQDPKPLFNKKWPTGERYQKKGVLGPDGV